MKNRRFIFLASLSFSLFALSFSLALAQDAIQCTPADVNLNRSLKFVNPASNNIYLGSGKLNFSSTDANLYATNDSGNLLLHNANANILIQSNNILFSDDIAGNNRLAGIYANAAGAGAAQNNNHGLVVDGKIEGWQVNGLNQICVQGKCIKDWHTSCVGTQKLTASGSTFSCSSDADTRCDASGTCNQLCIGASCYNSWLSAFQSTSGGTGAGVSKIIAGPGISVSGTGEGDVTVSTKIIWCDGACPAW